MLFVSINKKEYNPTSFWHQGEGDAGSQIRKARIFFFFELLLDPLGGHGQAKYRHAKSEELFGIYASMALPSIREPDFSHLLYLRCHESCELFWRVKME